MYNQLFEPNKQYKTGWNFKATVAPFELRITDINNELLFNLYIYKTFLGGALFNYS